MESTLYTNCQASFDYAAMAREAAKEQEVLHKRLMDRREAGPRSPDQELTWKRENAMLYNMYLEQRCNRKIFERRALLRSQGH